jgi:hypothetical protein
VLWPGYALGANVAAAAGAFSEAGAVGAHDAAALALLVVAGAWWIRNTRIAEGSSLARNVALLTLAMPAGGAVLHALFQADWGGYGLARIATAFVLALAILRHQLLGLDLGLRWTIKQSTVAAAFVGVFFVTSEGAQSFFAETTNSSIVGIIAAGALVFAMAPLQSAAERVASAAVPLAGDAPRARTGREDSFRAAVRLAMKGGRLTASEQRELAVLAEDLGVAARRAFKVVDEVAADRAAATGRRVEVER